MPSAELMAGRPALVAILRGVRADSISPVADALYESGWRAIEVPLNSPDPFASIAALAARRDLESLLVGAGTVLTPEEVRRTQEAGGRLVVSPNCDASVISAALRLGLQVMPGFATATEAFAACAAGARHLKLFPASSYGPRHLQALRAVLPADARVYPVGGIGAADIPGWVSAGAAGFGLGSELFRPGYSISDIRRRAQSLMAAYRAVTDPLDLTTAGHNP